MSYKYILVWRLLYSSYHTIITGYNLTTTDVLVLKKYIMTGKYNVALELISKLNREINSKIERDIYNDISILKFVCLCELKRYDEAINVFENLPPWIYDESFGLELYILEISNDPMIINTCKENLNFYIQELCELRKYVELKQLLAYLKSNNIIIPSIHDEDYGDHPVFHWMDFHPNESYSILHNYIELFENPPLRGCQN